MKLLLSILLPFYALDQFTKWLIVRNLNYGDVRVVIPNFFNLYHIGNTGAAFSAFTNSNTAFIVLSVIVFIVLIVAFLRRKFSSRWSVIALGLLLAGIAGNCTDRIIHKHVVDFLSFDLHIPLANPWPTFNVADSCICVAVAIFMTLSFRQAANEKAEKNR